MVSDRGGQTEGEGRGRGMGRGRGKGGREAAKLSPVGWPFRVKRGDRTMATTTAELGTNTNLH